MVLGVEIVYLDILEGIYLKKNIIIVVKYVDGIKINQYSNTVPLEISSY